MAAKAVKAKTKTGTAATTATLGGARSTSQTKTTMPAVTASKKKPAKTARAGG